MLAIKSKPNELERMRILAGYSQRGLSCKAGVNPATLNQAERKAKPVRPRTARAIADALGVEISALFDIVKEV